MTFFGKGNPEATPRSVVLWAVGGALGAGLFSLALPATSPMRSPWMIVLGIIVGAVGSGLAYWQLED